MLNNIPKIISPDLMRELMMMGHGDTVILADANFPAYTVCENVIRLDGVAVDELLEAILKFLPLDDFEANPVTIMDKRDEDEIPPVWSKFDRILKKSSSSDIYIEMEKVKRFDFYEKSKNTYLVVQTGSSMKYANIMIRKGVCVEEEK